MTNTAFTVTATWRYDEPTSMWLPSLQAALEYARELDRAGAVTVDLVSA